MHVDRPNPVDQGEAWLAMAARTAHVAVGVSRLADGAFVEVNDAFCRLFQYARHQVLGQTSATLGLWPDAPQRERLLALLRREGHVVGFEARYRNRLGEEGDLLVSATIVDRDGEQHLVGFLTEVSDRRELLDGLRAVQARLDVALRASGLIVLRQDRQMRYTWVANPALGVSESDVLGRTDVDMLGPEAAAPLVAVKSRVLASGRPERCDVWVANNGQLGCFDLVVEPDRDAGGQTTGIVCAAMDITQRMTGQPTGAQTQSTLQTIRGLTSLLDHEGQSPRQVQRLQRLRQAVTHLLDGPTTDAPPLETLRRRHAGTLVIVAEQNEVLRELAASLLDSAGLRVVSARNGVEAFSLAVQLTPRLLLLDMELPQRGGVAAARAVRATLGPTPRLVAMVSPAPRPDAARALDADLDDVIDKPIHADELYRKVLSWLDTP